MQDLSVLESLLRYVVVPPHGLHIPSRRQLLKITIECQVHDGLCSEVEILQSLPVDLDPALKLLQDFLLLPPAQVRDKDTGVESRLIGLDVTQMPGILWVVFFPGAEVTVRDSGKHMAPQASKVKELGNVGSHHQIGIQIYDLAQARVDLR